MRVSHMPLRARGFEVCLGCDLMAVGGSHRVVEGAHCMVMLEEGDHRDKEVGHRLGDLANLLVLRSRPVRQSCLVHHDPLDHQNLDRREVVWAQRRPKRLGGDCGLTLILQLPVMAQSVTRERKSLDRMGHSVEHEYLRYGSLTAERLPSVHQTRW